MSIGTKKPENREVEYHSNCLICPGSDLRPLEGYERPRLVQCTSCGLVFCRRKPTERELVEHYAQYERDTSVDSEVSRESRETVLDDFESERETNRLLDVGCGVGLFLDQASSRGWKTFGTEFSDDAIELCESNGHRMASSPLSADDFEHESFDVVVYTEVIEHIDNQSEEFDEVRKLLRPGGLLYVTTPNFDCLARRILGPDWSVIEYPEHLAYFTSSTLRHLFVSKGFEIDEIRTTGISVSRILRSLGGTDGEGGESDARENSAPADDNPCKDDSSIDQRLRRLMANSQFFGAVKSAVNAGLDWTNLGNSLKAWIRKPRTSGR